jgi:hypothetical protein
VPALAPEFRRAADWHHACLHHLREVIAMLGVLIGGLFTFLFGAIVLILVFGTRRIDDELNERQREIQKIRADAARIPRFIVVSPPTGARCGPLDEALFWQVQQYLEAEQLLADQFVLQPSMESLYRDSGRRPTSH